MMSDGDSETATKQPTQAWDIFRQRELRVPITKFRQSQARLARLGQYIFFGDLTGNLQFENRNSLREVQDILRKRQSVQKSLDEFTREMNVSWLDATLMLRICISIGSEVESQFAALELTQKMIHMKDLLLGNYEEDGTFIVPNPSERIPEIRAMTNRALGLRDNNAKALVNEMEQVGYGGCGIVFSMSGLLYEIHPWLGMQTVRVFLEEFSKDLLGQERKVNEVLGHTSKKPRMLLPDGDDFELKLLFLKDVKSLTYPAIVRRLGNSNGDSVEIMRARKSKMLTRILDSWTESGAEPLGFQLEFKRYKSALETFCLSEIDGLFL